MKWYAVVSFGSISREFNTKRPPGRRVSRDAVAVHRRARWLKDHGCSTVRVACFPTREKARDADISDNCTIVSHL